MVETVGIVKEIKVDEDRVAIAPSGVHSLIADGRQVLIQKGAGLGSGIPDGEYSSAGAEIVDEARRGRFSTIVIGRGSERQGPSSPLGGNADRVIRLAWDLNVIVAGAAETRP